MFGDPSFKCALHHAPHNLQVPESSRAGEKVGQCWDYPRQGLGIHWTEEQVPQAPSWVSEWLPNGHPLLPHHSHPASHEPLLGKKQKRVPIVNRGKHTSNSGCDVRDVQVSLCITGINKKSLGYYRKFLELGHETLTRGSPAGAQAAARGNIVCPSVHLSVSGLCVQSRGGQEVRNCK